MIPKIIHYCWFGTEPESDCSKRCFDGWSSILKGYRIKRWDESNSPLNGSYMQVAAAQKKWANMSNFVRLYAVVSEGGVYLDTDIEVIRPFDELLTLNAFVGFESKRPKVNNAVLGSRAGHPFFKKMLSELKLRHNGTERANQSSPELLTRLLRDAGLEHYSEYPQIVADIAIFPVQYFYPLRFKELFNANRIKPETYTIHHWEKRW